MTEKPLSRGQERRQGVRDKITVLDTIRGHESTIAHAFNHTEGICPKCGSSQQRFFFCLPGPTDLPQVRLCELEGEHLHRICAACSYPWVERPLDQAMLSEAAGEMTASSEMAAALAVILERTEGAELDLPLVQSRKGWIIAFARDPERRTITLSTRPAPPQVGRPAHPEPQSAEG